MVRDAYFFFFTEIFVFEVQGSFNSPGVGKYTFVFDNTYSYLNKKVSGGRWGGLVSFALFEYAQNS